MSLSVRIGISGVSFLVAAAGVLSVAPSASAVAADGVCNPDGNYAPDLCVYYSPNRAGAVYDHYGTINYQGRYFIRAGNGAGTGLHVRNNAASAWFRGPAGTGAGYVYYSPNQTGSKVKVSAGNWVNLGALRNENASQST